MALDNGIPVAAINSDSQDKYKVFLTAARMFFFLLLCIQKGQEPSGELPYASLATMCPSCPQPGINMDPGWESRPEKER